jgi:hypothetical protein
MAMNSFGVQLDPNSVGFRRNCVDAMLSAAE